MGLVLIPTLVVYGLLITGIVQFCRGKWSWWGLLLACLPLLDWSYEYIYARVYFFGPGSLGCRTAFRTATDDFANDLGRAESGTTVVRSASEDRWYLGRHDVDLYLRRVRSHPR